MRTFLPPFLPASRIVVLLIAALVPGFCGSVSAQSANDAQAASTGQSVTAGDVQQQDVSVTTSTDDWSGLYGQITTSKNWKAQAVHSMNGQLQALNPWNMFTQ